MEMELLFLRIRRCVFIIYLIFIILVLCFKDKKKIIVLYCLSK